MSKEQEKATETENEAQKNTSATTEKQADQEATESSSEIEALKTQNAELNEKFLRLYSDFDNFRKRTAKEKVDLIQSGGEDVYKVLLPVLDDFERAIKSNADIDDVETIKEGFQLIFTKFKNSLTHKGLAEMKALGEPFNTDLHEAITNIPAPTEDLKGKVVEELEKGYLLNEKVIRFAKVVVGN